MNKLLCLGSWFLTVALLFAGYSRTAEATAAPMANSTKIVCLLTGNDYPPFCFLPPLAAGTTSKQGGLENVAPGNDAKFVQGYAWDIARAAFHSQGYTVMLRVLAWREAAARARDNANAESVGSNKIRPGDYRVNLTWGGDPWIVLNNKKYTTAASGEEHAVLLFPTVHNLERDRVFVYSAEPVCRSRLVAYVSEKSPLTAVTPAALAGKRAGFLKEYTYGNLRTEYPDLKIMELDSIEAGFNLLRSGRLEVLFGYEATFDYALQKSGLSKLFRKFRTEKEVNEYLCALRTAPNAANLLAAFDAGVKAITANGTAAAIAKKWGIIIDK